VGGPEKKLAGNSDARISRVRSNPDLVAKETVAASLFIGITIMICALWDAPIEAPANPEGIPADNVKAPWIFVGIQFMLVRIDPLISGIIIPFLALVIISSAPFLPENTPGRRLGLWLAFHGIIAASLLLTFAGYFM
jgi:hypothetical protein